MPTRGAQKEDPKDQVGYRDGRLSRNCRMGGWGCNMSRNAREERCILIRPFVREARHGRPRVTAEACAKWGSMAGSVS